MFFTTTAPAQFRRPAQATVSRSLERFLAETQVAARQILKLGKQVPSSRVTELTIN